MKLKDILLEDFYIPDYVKRIKSDCRPFFKLNEDLLRSGFTVWRVSKKERDQDVTKVPHRTRNKIQGDVWRTFFYREFKPPDLPNRNEMFSCQGENPSDDLRGTEYAIFPVGSNYKMVYHPDVKDFNRPKYMDIRVSSFSLTRGIRMDLNLGITPKELKDPSKVHSETFQEIRDEIGENLDILYKRFNIAYNGSDEARKYNFDRFEQLWNFLVDNRDYYEKFLERTYQVVDNMKNYWKGYFDGLVETKSLSKDMSNREVSVYAPDGVYYLRTNPRKFKKTDLKFFFLDKLSKEKRRELELD